MSKIFLSFFFDFLAKVLWMYYNRIERERKKHERKTLLNHFKNMSRIVCFKTRKKIKKNELNIRSNQNRISNWNLSQNTPTGKTNEINVDGNVGFFFLLFMSCPGIHTHTLWHISVSIPTIYTPMIKQIRLIRIAHRTSTH